MIAVNLLPAEMRKLDRTPLPRQLAIFGSVGINFIALLWLLTLHIGSIPAAASTNKDYNEQIYQLTKIRKVDTDYRALVAAKGDFEKRQSTIEKIDKTRVRWAKKLDLLWDLVPPSIWFSSLELREPEKPTGRGTSTEPTGTMLIIIGYTNGTNIGEVARFIDSLQTPAEEGKESFFDGFVKIHDPVFERDTKTYKKFGDAVVVKFTLRLEMEPPKPDKPAAAGTSK